MNREIKFRGKSIMNNTCGDWLYSSGIKYGDDVELMYCDEDTSEEWNYIDKETVGQYTGLHDKNGKEIYEGDIVQGLFADQEEPEIKGQVIYSNGQASYIVIASNNDEWELGYLDNLEVIGNIYDNPELLGGK